MIDCQHAFLIGAAKCGTTSVSRWLDQNPQICLSRPKEPIFFEADFDRGVHYYHSTYFSHYRGEQLLLDARHRNMFLPYVPERVAIVEPFPLLIAIVREPVTRAYSHWWHHFCRGQELLSFEDAVEENLHMLAVGRDFTGVEGIALWTKNLERDSRGVTQRGFGVRTYVDSGYYAPQLKQYLDLFGSNQLHVMFLEELAVDPETHLKELAHFLRIPLHSATLAIRNEATAVSCWRNIVRHITPTGSRALIPPPLRHSLSKARSKQRRIPSISTYTAQRLQEHYAPYNAELENLLGRRLPSNWVID